MHSSRMSGVRLAMAISKRNVEERRVVTTKEKSCFVYMFAVLVITTLSLIVFAAVQGFFCISNASIRKIMQKSDFATFKIIVCKLTLL